MRADELRIEVPALRDENEGIPVIACISRAGIRYIAQEERGDVEIGDELWWDHFVAWELASRLLAIKGDLRESVAELTAQFPAPQ